MRILIIGAGGYSQVVADIVLLSKRAGEDVDLAGYLDDNDNLHGASLMGAPVLGRIDAITSFPHDAVVISIGNTTVRGKMFSSLQEKGETVVTVCHPSAVIAPSATIGIGTIICAGVVVNPCAMVGNNVILNTTCMVEHHNHIGDHAHIAAGAHLGGDVVVGKGTMVGMGATVMPQITVGEWSVVGAGAVVTKNVPPYSVVVGVPARVIRELTPPDNEPPAGGHN